MHSASPSPSCGFRIATKKRFQTVKCIDTQSAYGCSSNIFQFSVIPRYLDAAEKTLFSLFYSAFYCPPPNLVNVTILSFTVSYLSVLTLMLSPAKILRFCQQHR